MFLDWMSFLKECNLNYLKTNNVIYEVFVTIYSEIVDILKIIDPNKAFGPDKISHKMLNISPEKIAIPLQIIFSKSLVYMFAYNIFHYFSDTSNR
jgi:hypothetical protein